MFTPCPSESYSKESSDSVSITRVNAIPVKLIFGNTIFSSLRINEGTATSSDFEKSSSSKTLGCSQLLLTAFNIFSRVLYKFNPCTFSNACESFKDNNLASLLFGSRASISSKVDVAPAKSPIAICEFATSNKSSTVSFCAT